MPAVTMTRNVRVALDGVSVTRCVEGETYQVPDDVARNLISGNLAREAKVETPEDAGGGRKSAKK